MVHCGIGRGRRDRPRDMAHHLVLVMPCPTARARHQALGLSRRRGLDQRRPAEGHRGRKAKSVDCVRIVHLLRHSLDFVSWKDRKSVAAALKDIYRAVDAAAAEAALGAFEESPWGKKYPAIGQSWRRAWAEVIPFYAFPGEVRRILYTTNAIEALNSKLRRAVRARVSTPERRCIGELEGIRCAAPRWDGKSPS